MNRIMNYLGQINDRIVDKNKYMCGWEVENSLAQRLMLIMIHTIKFILYKCKIRHVLPTIANMKYEIDELVYNLSKRLKWREAGIAGHIVSIFVIVQYEGTIY